MMRTDFGENAQQLARNPLGIIALFIVLVYGLAALVTTFSGFLSQSERIPLIWFLVVFPVLVLISFTWLVSKHSGKLFAPSDFQDEENYIRMQMAAVASLAAASTGPEESKTELDIQMIVDAVREAELNDRKTGSWQNHVLWVDDRPENNVYERKAFEATGLRFTLALSTNQALEMLSREKFAAIISDMGRVEGPREGYALLDALRESGDQTPFFIYAGSNLPEHKREAFDHGAQGSTNNARELYQVVMKAVVST